MNKAIIGKKLGMSQVFTEDGIVIPVTVVEAGPCPVVQKKTVDKDGYDAVQVAFGSYKDDKRADKLTNKPLKGHYAKAGVKPMRTLKEFRLDDCAAYEVGGAITCDVFAAGDKVDVVGTSKGHGFTGAIKRWNQHCGPMAHGSKYHRHAGSNGPATSPGRVFKGKKMPGQMGNVRVTVQNLEVVRVDADNNLILGKGAVPGAKKGLVMLKETVKSAN